MADKMRIIIFGVAVGGLLALSGTPVILVGRPNNFNAIREHGLKLLSPSVPVS